MLARVVVGEDGAAFETYARVSAEVEGLLHHHVGAGEGFVYAPGVVLALEADVVAEVRVDDVLAGKRILNVAHARQLLPLCLDQGDCVFRLAARLGDDRGDRFTLPARAVDGDRVLRRRLDAL